MGSVKDLVTNNDNYQKNIHISILEIMWCVPCHSAKGSRVLVLDTEHTARRVLRRDPREALHNLHFTPALFRRKRSQTQLRSALILIGLRLLWADRLANFQCSEIWPLAVSFKIALFLYKLHLQLNFLQGTILDWTKQKGNTTTNTSVWGWRQHFIQLHQFKALFKAQYINIKKWVENPYL